MGVVKAPMCTTLPKRIYRTIMKPVVLENNNGPLTQLSAEGLPLFRSSLQQDVHVSFQEVDPGEPGSADVQCVRRAAE